MPYTLNGIGTHYYGRKNAIYHAGVCPHCGRQATLGDYDTREWFVIVFIPIIPVGRYHIRDYCPLCTRHYRIPMADWNRGVGEVVEKGREALAARRDDPDAAAEYLGVLSHFRRDEEARVLVEHMRQRFADHAGAMTAAGEWCRQHGRTGEAQAAFEAALKASPEDAAVRAALAATCLQNGDLRRAGELAGYPNGLGDPPDAGLLLALARAFQARGEHGEALRGFRRVLAVAPRLGQDRTFRREVAQSERAEPPGASILPGQRLLKRRSVRAAAVLLLALAAAGALFGLDRLVAARRPLHVVNGLEVPVAVRVDGGREVTVGPHARQVLNIGEGRHEAVVRIGPDWVQTVPMDMGEGSFGALFRSPVYVLNAGGGAVLARETVTYSTSPSAEADPERTVHAGTAFLRFDGSDYTFTEPPKKIKIESGNRARKTALTVLEAGPEDWSGLLEAGVGPENVAAFLEGHVRAQPEAPEPAEALLTFAWGQGPAARRRAMELFASGLDARPVRVAWHRHYQNLRQLLGEDDGLEQEYRRRLEADPSNAAWLYLIGRLLPRTDKARELYDRAIAADPKLDYAYIGRTHSLLLEGDFAAAKATLEKAKDLPKDEATWAQLMRDVRMALGEHAALAAEARKALAAAPLDFGAVLGLMEALAAAGDSEGVRRAQAEFCAEAARQGAPDSSPLVRPIPILAANLTGDHEQALKLISERIEPDDAQGWSFMPWLLTGRLSEAAAVTGDDDSPVGSRAERLLALSIAHGAAGDAPAAERWREQARQELLKGDGDCRHQAALLAKGNLPSSEDLHFSAGGPGMKALILTALAQAHPAKRGELLPMARRLAYRPSMMDRLVRQAIEAMSKADDPRQ